MIRNFSYKATKLIILLQSELFL